MSSPGGCWNLMLVTSLAARGGYWHNSWRMHLLPWRKKPLQHLLAQLLSYLLLGRAEPPLQALMVQVVLQHQQPQRHLSRCLHPVLQRPEVSQPEPWTQLKGPALTKIWHLWRSTNINIKFWVFASAGFTVSLLETKHSVNYQGESLALTHGPSLLANIP